MLIISKFMLRLFFLIQLVEFLRNKTFVRICFKFILSQEFKFWNVFSMVCHGFLFYLRRLYVRYFLPPATPGWCQRNSEIKVSYTGFLAHGRGTLLDKCSRTHSVRFSLFRFAMSRFLLSVAYRFDSTHHESVLSNVHKRGHYPWFFLTVMRGRRSVSYPRRR